MTLTRLLMIAVLVGAAGFAGGLYAMSSREGNQAAASCSAGESERTAMTPHATGELAAFVVSETPVPLPAMTFKDADGADRSLTDWAGKTVLLNLWATWCVPCREEMPDLDRLQAEFSKDEFEVVAISLDRAEPAVPAAFLDEIQTRHLELYTDQTSDVFEALKTEGVAFGLPTTVLIDGSGCRVGHLLGPAKWDADEAIALIRAAINPAGT